MPSFSMLFALFCVLTAVVSNFTIVLMASPYIVSDLGGSNDIAIYTVAFFGVGSAIGVPIGKPIAARMGSAKALVACVAAFTFCSWLCAIVPNYPLFIACRFLLGFAAGPIYPILNHLLSHVVPSKYLPHALAIFVTILAVGPVFAACWGGFIAYEYIWRWAFYFNIPFFTLLSFFLWNRIGHYPQAPDKVPFDWIGYLFFSLGTFSLSLIAIMAQQLDWYRSPLLLTCFFIGLPSFLFFLLWSWHHPYPIVELHFFKRGTFAYGIFNLAILFSVYFGTIVLLSLWLTLYVQYTPLWIAVLLGGMAIAGLIPSLLIQEKLGSFDPRYPLAAAIILLAISCFHTTIFSVEINFERIAVSRVIAGFGLAIFLSPLFQLCFQSFPAEKSIDVIAIFQIVRNLAAGLGAAIYDIIWQRRQVFFHERLGEQLNVFSQQTKDFLQRTKQYFVPGDPNAQLDYYLERQARALALEDTFWLMSWILVGLLFLLFMTLSVRFKLLKDPSNSSKDS